MVNGCKHTHTHTHKHDPAMFGDHRNFVRRNFMISVYHMTLQDNVIKVLYEFIVRGSSRKAAILPSLVAICTLILET